MCCCPEIIHNDLNVNLQYEKLNMLLRI